METTGGAAKINKKQTTVRNKNETPRGKNKYFRVTSLGIGKNEAIKGIINQLKKTYFQDLKKNLFIFILFIACYFEILSPQ